MSKEECLALAARRCDELQALNKPDIFYGYETEFGSIWKGPGREVWRKTAVSCPLTSGKKRLATTLGCISFSRANAFSGGSRGFQISARLQAPVADAGRLDGDGRLNEIRRRFRCVRAGATEVFASLSCRAKNWEAIVILRAAANLLFTSGRSAVSKRTPPCCCGT